LNGSNRVQAIDIKCEVGEVATLKCILLQSEMNISELGSFVPVATRLANPQLHRTMFNKHAAFVNDMVTVHVEGLHDDVLDELMHCGSTPKTEKSIREILKLTELQDVCPVWAIEYTEESEEDGKFYFVTSKENVELVESVVNNQLQQMAMSTVSYRKHRNKNDKFRAGIRVVPRRPNRRSVYESRLHTIYKDVTEAESASARQGSRNRPMVQDVRWTTLEFPPLQAGNFVPVATQPRSYMQVAQRQGAQQNQAQRIGDQFRTARRTIDGSSVAGDTVQNNSRAKSVTSELGNDDATIMTTLQEQSAQIQKLEEIVKGHTAQQAKINTLIEEKMAERQKLHEDELAAQQLALEERFKRHVEVIETGHQLHLEDLFKLMEANGKQAKKDHNEMFTTIGEQIAAAVANAINSATIAPPTLQVPAGIDVAAIADASPLQCPKQRANGPRPKWSWRTQAGQGTSTRNAI
jgi:hypothetical protein